MCRPSYGTLLLILAACYIAVCSHAKALQGTQKLDLANPGTAAAATRLHNSLGGVGGGASEARRKRAMGDYKELNDIIDELEENSVVAQKALNSAGNAAMVFTAPVSQPQEFDLDSMPPLTYYLLVQKLKQLQSSGEPAYRVRTPRLGRSIDFQQLLDVSGAGVGRMAEEDSEATGNLAGGGGGGGAGMSRQFVSHMMKKSVPFKPRLGKRAQVCGATGSGNGVGVGGGVGAD